LPTTFPRRIEDTPAFGNFPGASGEVRYGEGLLMGYRWYDTRRVPARFPFGHGLSYTTFSIGAPRVRGNGPIVVDVTVINTGKRVGSEVVQCYVEPVDPPVFRPTKELKAFQKVELAPEESTTVSLVLDDRAFAYWEPDGTDYARVKTCAAEHGYALGASEPIVPPPSGWTVHPGEYRLHIGRSIDDIAHVVTIAR
jgi:beta-glucosidase